MTKTEINKILVRHIEEYRKENKLRYDQCMVTDEYNKGFNDAMKKIDEVVKFIFSVDEEDK